MAEEKEDKKEEKKLEDLHPDELEMKTFEESVKQDNVFNYPTINSAFITGGTKLEIGSGDKCFKFHPDKGLWMGNPDYDTAPFKVSIGGDVAGSSFSLTNINGDLDDISDGTNYARVVKANLDTSSKEILADFTFGASGAIKMITDANNGLWISPTGILAKKSGDTTLTIGNDGDATFAGTLAATGGTFGAITGGSININDVFVVDSSGNVKANSLERDDFHWFTLFESLDGYGQTTEGTGSITLNQGEVILKTGNVNSNITELQKFQTNPQSQFTWDKDRKFKILVRFVTNTSCETRIACGDGQTETGRKLGFLIVNDAIYGEVANGTTRELTSSTSFDANDYKLLEIKYTSGTSASFYINGSLLGTLSTYLPSGTTIAGNLLDIHMQVKTNAAVKEMWVNYFDFWQAN
jgi:hypothetical protein